MDWTTVVGKHSMLLALEPRFMFDGAGVAMPDAPIPTDAIIGDGADVPAGDSSDAGLDGGDKSTGTDAIDPTEPNAADEANHKFQAALFTAGAFSDDNGNGFTERDTVRPMASPLMAILQGESQDPGAPSISIPDSKDHLAIDESGSITIRDIEVADTDDNGQANTNAITVTIWLSSENDASGVNRGNLGKLDFTNYNPNSHEGITLTWGNGPEDHVVGEYATITATADKLNDILGAFNFNGEKDANGQQIINIKVSDGSKDTTSQIFVDITPQNSDPTYELNLKDDNFSTPEDEYTQLKDAVKFTDLDFKYPNLADRDSLTVTLAVGKGSFYIKQGGAYVGAESLANVTLLNGVYTITGTDAEVNANLSGLYYKNTTENYYGTDTLTVKYWDKAGAANPGTFDVDIKITPVDDAPTIDPTATLTTGAKEGQKEVLLTADLFKISDVDNDPVQLVVTIRGLPIHGKLQIKNGENSFSDLVVGNTFTYKDIIDSKLYYSHDGSQVLPGDLATLTDSFVFSVYDGAGSTYLSGDSGPKVGDLQTVENGPGYIAGQPTNVEFTIDLTPVNQKPGVATEKIAFYEGQDNVEIKIAINDLDDATYFGNSADDNVFIVTKRVTAEGTTKYFEYGTLVRSDGKPMTLVDRADLVAGETLTGFWISAKALADGKLIYQHDGSDAWENGTPKFTDRSGITTNDQFAVYVLDGGGGEGAKLGGFKEIRLEVKPNNDMPYFIDGSKAERDDLGQYDKTTKTYHDEDHSIAGGTNVIDDVAGVVNNRGNGVPWVINLNPSKTAGAAVGGLNVMDRDSLAGAITYTIKDSPGFVGTIRRIIDENYTGPGGNEEPYVLYETLGTGSSFTQAEVDAGKIVYVAGEGGTETDPLIDQLVLEVRDGSKTAWYKDPVTKDITTTGIEGGVLDGVVDGKSDFKQVSVIFEIGKLTDDGKAHDGVTIPDPTLAVTGSTVDVFEDSFTVLTDTMLEVTHSYANLPAGVSTPANPLFVYTLEVTPEYGELCRWEAGKWVPLNTYDTFTQADVHNGRIAYRHKGTEDFTDHLKISVFDPDTDTRTYLYAAANQGATKYVQDATSGIDQNGLIIHVKASNDTPVITDVTKTFSEGTRGSQTSSPGGFSDGLILDHTVIKIGDSDSEAARGGTGNYNDNGFANDTNHADTTFVFTSKPQHGAIYVWIGGEGAPSNTNYSDVNSWYKLTDANYSTTEGSKDFDEWTTTFKLVSENKSDVIKFTYKQLVDGCIRYVHNGEDYNPNGGADPANVGFTEELTVRANDGKGVEADTDQSGQTSPTDGNKQSISNEGKIIINITQVDDPPEQEKVSGDAKGSKFETPENGTFIPATQYEGKGYTRDYHQDSVGTVITASHLSYTDTDSSNVQLQYFITATPSQGALYLFKGGTSTEANGVWTHTGGGTWVQLGVESVFTQQDIIDGRVKYVHNGEETHHDYFDFQIGDGVTTIVQGNDALNQGGTVVKPSVRFDIYVLPANNPPEITVDDGKVRHGDGYIYLLEPEGVALSDKDLSGVFKVSDRDYSDVGEGNAYDKFKPDDDASDGIVPDTTDNSTEADRQIQATIYAAKSGYKNSFNKETGTGGFESYKGDAGVELWGSFKFYKKDGANFVEVDATALKNDFNVTVVSSDTGMVQLLGSEADINTALAMLRYVPGKVSSTADSRQDSDLDSGVDIILVVNDRGNGDGSDAANKNEGDNWDLKAESAVKVFVSTFNDPPTSINDQTITTPEDTAVQFSKSIGGMNSPFADVDGIVSGNGNVAVLTVGHGKLSFEGGLPKGVTQTTSKDSQTGATTVTLTGSLAGINAAMKRLTYTGDHNWNGPDTLRVEYSDGMNQNNVADAVFTKDCRFDIAITVTPVNDTPTLNVPANTDVEPIAVSNNIGDKTPIQGTIAGKFITIGDVDLGDSATPANSNNLTNNTTGDIDPSGNGSRPQATVDTVPMSVTLTTTYNGADIGALTLKLADNDYKDSGTFNFGAGDVTITKNDNNEIVLTGSKAAINAALAKLNFGLIAGDDPNSINNQKINLHVKVDDNANGGDGALTVEKDLTLFCSAANNPPVVTPPGGQPGDTTANLTTHENTAVVFGSGNGQKPIVITDPDGRPAFGDIAATKITVVLSVTHGKLEVVGEANKALITAGANNTATVTLVGTLEQIDAVLNGNGGLKFHPTNDDINNTTAVLTVKVSDDGSSLSLGHTGAAGHAPDVSINIKIEPVNDAPYFATTDNGNDHAEKIPANSPVTHQLGDVPEDTAFSDTTDKPAGEAGAFGPQAGIQVKDMFGEGKTFHFSDYKDGAHSQTGAAAGTRANAFTGVIVTHVDETGTGTGACGSWQYYDTTANKWVDFWTDDPNRTAVGSGIANSAGIYLAKDAAIRFVPVANYNGPAPTLTIHLVEDGSNAGNAAENPGQPNGLMPAKTGDKINLSDGKINGAADASFSKTQISTNTGKIAVDISPVNDAPEVTGNPAELVMDEDTPKNFKVDTVFNPIFQDTIDNSQTPTDLADDFAGIVITGIAGTPANAGTWKYSTDNGTTWTSLPADLAESKGLFLDKDALLRFEPNQDYNGPAPSLTTHVVEVGHGYNNGATGIDLTAAGAKGGTSHVSDASASVTLKVNPINDAPRPVDADGKPATGNDQVKVDLTMKEDRINDVKAHDANAANGLDSNNGWSMTELFNNPNANGPAKHQIFDDSRDASPTDHDNDFAGVIIKPYTANANQGVWQYSLDGNTWAALPTSGDPIFLAASARIRFEPNPNYNGLATAIPTLSVHMVEMKGEGGQAALPAGFVNGTQLSWNYSATGQVSEFSVLVTMEVTPTNDGPDLTVPTTTAADPKYVEVNRDNGINYYNKITGISVADPDYSKGDWQPGSNNADVMQVTITATRNGLADQFGMLKLDALPANLQGKVAVTGSDSSQIILKGTLADINATLAYLLYSADGANNRDAITLTVVANDCGNGQKLIGQDTYNDQNQNALTDKDYIYLTVATSPLVNFPEGDNALKTIEDKGGFTFTGDHALTVGSSQLPNDTAIKVTVKVEHGELKFEDGYVKPAWIVENADGSYTFTGTKAEVNAALANLHYTPPEDFHGSDTLSVTTLDTSKLVANDPNSEANLSNTFDKDINVTPVNDAPTIGGDTKGDNTVCLGVITNNTTTNADGSTSIYEAVDNPATGKAEEKAKDGWTVGDLFNTFTDHKDRNYQYGDHRDEVWLDNGTETDLVHGEEVNMAGIIVTGLDDQGKGAWQYYDSVAGAWKNFTDENSSPLSDANGLFLAADTKIRFVPKAGAVTGDANPTPAFTARVVDSSHRTGENTQFNQGQYVDLTDGKGNPTQVGEETSVSQATAKFEIEIKPFNHKPDIDKIQDLTIAEGDNNPVNLASAGELSDPNLDNSWLGVTLTIQRVGGPNASDVFGFALGSDFTLATNNGLTVISKGGVDLATVVTNANGTLTLKFTQDATTVLVNEILHGITYRNTNPPTGGSVELGYTLDDANPNLSVYADSLGVGDAVPQGLGGNLDAFHKQVISFPAAPAPAPDPDPGPGPDPEVGPGPVNPPDPTDPPDPDTPVGPGPSDPTDPTDPTNPTDPVPPTGHVPDNAPPVDNGPNGPDSNQPQPPVTTLPPGTPTDPMGNPANTPPGVNGPQGDDPGSNPVTTPDPLRNPSPLRYDSDNPSVNFDEFYGDIADEKVPIGGELGISVNELFHHTGMETQFECEATLKDGESLPEWITFDKDSMQLMVEPPEGVTEGAYEIIIRAKDSEGRMAEALVLVKVGDSIGVGDNDAADATATDNGDLTDLGGENGDASEGGIEGEEEEEEEEEEETQAESDAGDGDSDAPSDSAEGEGTNAAETNPEEQADEVNLTLADEWLLAEAMQLRQDAEADGAALSPEGLEGVHPGLEQQLSNTGSNGIVNRARELLESMV